MFGTQQYFVAPQIMQPTVMTTSLLKSNSITGYVKPYCSHPLQPASCDGIGMMIRPVQLSAANSPINDMASVLTAPVPSVLPTQLPENSDTASHNFPRGKRKLPSFGSDDATFVKPAKVFVNEERMSMHMHNLQLDNNNQNCQPDLEQQPWYSQQAEPLLPVCSQTAEAVADQTSEVLIGNHMKTVTNRLGKVSAGVEKKFTEQPIQRIEFCPELELGLKTKQLLPQVILDDINKASMQIVLWRPLGDCFKNITSCPTTSDQTSESVTDMTTEIGSTAVGNGVCQSSETAPVCESSGMSLSDMLITAGDEMFDGCNGLDDIDENSMDL